MQEETEAREARSFVEYGRKRRMTEMEGKKEELKKEDQSSPSNQVSCCTLGVERNLKI